MKPFLLAFLAASLSAQSDRRALTNHDVVVLAKAGFTEEFIIDTIAAKKSEFDTSASSLADLAKEGLNDRVLRAMTGVKSDLLPASPPSAGMSPGTEKKSRAQIVNPTRAGLAIATQTPYSESTSFLFGLFRKKIRVGVVPHPDQTIASQFGANIAPSGSATRYVVIP